MNILGTSAESIDIAEDREKFSNLLKRLNLRQPESGIARSLEEALKVLERLGFPVLVRPSYVLGGRAMEIIYDLKTFEDFVREALIASPYQSILIDKFLEDAIEVDVDLIGDGENFVIGGVMEHIEEAGIHSGDSAMCLPPYSLTEEQITKIKEATYKLACALKIKGLMNVQYAIKDDNLFVLEVNPRASRTIPFVSKAIGVPLAKLATKVMLGRTLKELGFTKEVEIPYFSIKESVFPFNRFPGVDIILGPEMKSTGEVMGIDFDFGKAFMKSQLAASQNLPRKGCVFISVKNKDKRAIVFVAKKLQDLGFEIISTEGTGKVLNRYGVKAKIIPKIQEGRPNILDYIKDRKVHLIINTPSGRIPRQDEVRIRSEAIMHNIPCITTISGAQASVNGIESLLREDLKVVCIQEYHSLIKK